MLGEAYTPEDEEDSAVAEITAVWAYQARYRIPLTKAIAGAPLSIDQSYSPCAALNSEPASKRSGKDPHLVPCLDREAYAHCKQTASQARKEPAIRHSDSVRNCK